MSQTFGRRTPVTGSWTPPPFEPKTGLASARAASVEPEFEAWSRARTKTRWKTWGMAGLLVLGGPLCFLLPEPFGALAGWGLAACGGLTLFLRRGRTGAEPAPTLGGFAPED